MKKHIIRFALAAAAMSNAVQAQNSFPPSGPALATQFAVVAPGSQFEFIHLGAPKDMADYGMSLGPHINGLGPVVGMSGWAGLGFFTSRQSRLWIDAAGKVGIGTTQPGAELHVNGNIAFNRLTGLDTVELSVATIRSQHLLFGAGTQRRAIVDTSDGLTINYGNDWQQLIVGGQTVIVQGNLVGRGNVTIVGKTTTSTLELTSDRNQKQDFKAVLAAEVLAKVAALPVTSWAYTNSPNVRHLGPMAQDFKAAFNLGEDDKHIGAGDGIGVALAAIQGLHKIVQEKDSEIATLQRQVAAMKQELASVKDSVTDRLAALEKAVSKSAVQQASFRLEATR